MKTYCWFKFLNSLIFSCKNQRKRVEKMQPWIAIFALFLYKFEISFKNCFSNVFKTNVVCWIEFCVGIKKLIGKSGLIKNVLCLVFTHLRWAQVDFVYRRKWIFSIHSLLGFLRIEIEHQNNFSHKPSWVRFYVSFICINLCKNFLSLSLAI